MGDSNLFRIFYWVFILSYFSVPFCVGEVQVSANISNTGPILTSDIPNFTWPANESLIYAFDLDDFFMDPNGDEITFSATSVQNVTISIDSENRVSFFPDISFVGVRNLTFNASDGSAGPTRSNLVFLNIGSDSQAPQWSNPRKSKVNIYQNSYVNFSVDWVDDLGLKEFIFSINEGGGWTNYSAANFSGRSNTSRQSIQISAPGETNVSWRVYGIDLISNVNVTNIQYFTVKSPPTSSGSTDSEEDPDSEGEGGESTASSSSAAASSSSQTSKATKNLSFDFSFLFIEIFQGKKGTKILKITNTGSTNLTINLYQQNLEKILLMNKNSFALSSGETEAVTLEFSIPDYFLPEQYFGYLVVNSSAGLRKVPITIEVNKENSELLLKLNISKKYKVVSPGKDVVANITLSSSNQNAEKITLYYAIKDINGNPLWGEEEELSNEGLQFLERRINVPRDAQLGEYIFFARASTSEDASIDSDFFEVGSKIKLAAILKYGSYLIIIFLLSLIVLLLAYKFHQKRERERLLKLYLLMTELKTLLQEDKYEQAINLYNRIRTDYGIKVKSGLLEDKEKLLEEIKKISSSLKNNLPKTSVEEKETKKEAGPEVDSTSQEKTMEEKKEEKKDAKD